MCAGQRSAVPLGPLETYVPSYFRRSKNT